MSIYIAIPAASVFYQFFIFLHNLLQVNTSEYSKLIIYNVFLDFNLTT